MADSHGDADALSLGIRFLQEKKCFSIFHLGDICDSAKPETAQRCISLIRENHVLAIKGNNDHVLSVCGNESAEHSHMLNEDAAFLGELPQVRKTGNAIFTHSLPFEKELGLSGMIRAMGDSQADSFFARYPEKVLFRGHSHEASMMRKNGKGVISRAIQPDEVILLQNHIPCVITCGALCDGFCMIWERDPGRLFSYRLFSPGDGYSAGGFS